MTVQEIIDLAWSWLDDPEVPHRWPLVEMVALLDKTVNEFCELTRILVDSTTPELTEFVISAGTAKYPQDERVIEILRGRLIKADQKITRRTRTFMDVYCYGWDSALASPGTPRHILGDLDTGTFTLVPTPDADDTLKTTVVRYPLRPLTTASSILSAALPEIPFRYHFDLLDGICARAYLKQDPETYDPKKAERHRALWLSRCNQIGLNIINENDIDNLVDQVPDYLDN
jgi:hypothetical protein